MIVKKIVFFVIIFFILIKNAKAETVGVVEDIVYLDFKPTAVFAIVEDELGKLTRYPAFLPQMFIEGERRFFQSKEYYVLSPIKIKTSSNLIRFLFVFIGEDFKLASSRVKESESKDVVLAASSIPELNSRVSLKSVELTKVNLKLKELEDSYASIELKAIELASLDRLIEMSQEMEARKFVMEKNKQEKERLQELIEEGRSYESKLDLDELRKQLAIDLQETAKATAVADRLALRKKRSAVSNMQKKLLRIQESRNIDIEGLMRELSALKNKRKELEKELKMESSPEDREF